MDWVKVILGGLISTSSVAAIVAIVSREWFTRLLNRRFELFKHELQIEAKTRELALKSQIEFKERQLSEFYGPIYSRLKRGRALVGFWKSGKLRGMEPQFWELAQKTNCEIEEIILTKSHLIDGDEIPKSFIQFLTHVPIWHGFQGVVPLTIEEFPEAYYTEEFEKDIYRITKELKKKLETLYLHFGLVESKDGNLPVSD